jgi:hypothetical protein
MASIVDSEASFLARSKAIGFPQELIQKLVDAGINSAAKLAFSCNYNPQSNDDKPLEDMITAANGGNPITLGQMACLRRMFFEAHTLVMADLKTQVEKTDDQAPRKIPAPERNARYEAQQRRLLGVALSGELEPAHSLIDAVLQQAEDQAVKYLPPHKCPKREAELQAVKHDAPLTLDTSAGRVVLGKQIKEVVCDTSTELKTLWALQRRGLAYDQADLIRWDTHEAWLKELFSHLTRPAPPGFSSPSLQQLLRADRELFVKMGEQTRGGITARPTGVLPLDEAMKTLMFAAQVQFHLLPLPGSFPKQQFIQQSSSSQEFQHSNKRQSSFGSEEQPAKRPSPKGSGKSRGGKFVKGRGIPAMPNELKGMWFKTKEGKRICFAFNMQSGCSFQGNCPKGEHVCCKPFCGKNHSMKDHRD